jgi:hypothetical protein
MKLKITLFFLLIFSVNILGQEFKTPVEYLTFIGKEQDNISRNMWKYTLAVAHSKSARRIDNTRKNLIKIIQNSSTKISNLTNGYNGDLEYRNQVLDFLSISEKSINEDYSKIIDLQEVAEQSYDFMEAYITTRDLVNKKIEAENEKVILAQKVFAQKYNINLTLSTSILGEKMKISSEVFKYHTDLYLIFFKVNMTDLLLSNAIRLKDAGAIQQQSSAMIAYANEGLEKLNKIQKFKNDGSVVVATKNALNFYIKQSNEFVPSVLKFYLFNDKFENIKKSIESKSQKDRTNDEVEKYNQMVKQANEEIDNYNLGNTKIFNEKQQINNNWQTISGEFISRHVPQE